MIRTAVAAAEPDERRRLLAQLAALLRAPLTWIGRRLPDEADPCVCDRASPFVIYDANGWRTWCGRCRGRLW